MGPVRLQHRDVLVAYYSTAGTLPTNHSLLGRVAIVALWRFGDDEKLRKALRLGKREDCEPFAHRAEKLVRAAHREWNRAAQEAAGNWVEGKRET